MSTNVRLAFASCVAVLLLARAATGCASPSSSSSGDVSSSSAGSSSSSGGVCDHCSTVEMMGGSEAPICPASKATYDAVEACKCGPMCMSACAFVCGDAGLDTTCTVCLDAMCHNQIAACLGDQ